MSQPSETPGDIVVYVGTYTQGDSGKGEGVYVYRLNSSSGALTFESVFKGIANPTYLTIHPSRRFLYSVGEVSKWQGKPSGGVTAFRIDPKTAALSLLNQQSSEGAGPCYVSVEKTGKFLLVANYGQGSAAMLPIQPDGRLAPASDVIQHRGSGIDPGRQEGPHLHSILPDPANRYAFAQDLGIDKVMIYRMDLERGKLALHSETPVKPGAGPRHFVFHPTGGFAYLINELDSTIIAYAWDADRGALKELQTANALPDGFKGQSTCADIHVSQSGRFLYGSNRGHDSIVIYAIDERTGALKLVGHEPTWGRTPRGFDIDPTGAFLLTANQESHTIVTFRIDKRTGKLALTDHVAEVPSPVCVKMVPYEELAKAAP